MLPVPFSRRDRLMSAVGPDDSGSNPGIECVQMPEKSGMDAEPCGCPKTGIAAADTNVPSRRKFRGRVFMLSSLSWFRQHVSDNAIPCAHAVERASDNSWRRTVVLHSKALHGNPFDGHTLGPVVADMERVTGVEVARIYVDKGYRGHNYPNRFRVWISGQVRRVTKTIRREMKRRAAVEPVIGHLKAEHRIDRNHLKGHEGDRINAVLAAAGFNFPLLLRWFE